MCIGQSYKCSGAWEMILNDMEKIVWYRVTKEKNTWNTKRVRPTRAYIHSQNAQFHNPLMHVIPPLNPGIVKSNIFSLISLLGSMLPL